MLNVLNLFQKKISKQRQITIRNKLVPYFSWALASVLRSSVWVDQWTRCHLGCRGWSSVWPQMSLRSTAGPAQQQGSLEICREPLMAANAVNIFLRSVSLVEQQHLNIYPKNWNIQQRLCAAALRDETNLIDSPVALLQTKTTGNITWRPWRPGWPNTGSHTSVVTANLSICANTD